MAAAIGWFTLFVFKKDISLLKLIGLGVEAKEWNAVFGVVEWPVTSFVRYLWDWGPLAIRDAVGVPHSSHSGQWMLPVPSTFGIPGIPFDVMFPLPYAHMTWFSFLFQILFSILNLTAGEPVTLISGNNEMDHSLWSCIRLLSDWLKFYMLNLIKPV